MELGANPDLMKRLQKEKEKLWREEVQQKEPQKQQNTARKNKEEPYTESMELKKYTEQKEREAKKIGRAAEITDKMILGMGLAQQNKQNVWSETSLPKQLELLQSKVEQFKDKPEIRQAYENKIIELQKEIKESDEDTGGSVIIDPEVASLDIAAEKSGRLIRKVPKKKQSKKTMDTSPKIKRDESFSDEALAARLEAKKIEERKTRAEKIILGLSKRRQFLLAGEKAKVVAVDRKAKTILFETRFGEETKSFDQFVELYSEKEIKTGREVTLERKNTLEEIAEYVRNHGIDRIVVHGEPRYVMKNGEQKVTKAAELDFDTQIALYFLNYNQNFKPRRKGALPSTIYNAGADTEFVMKGEKTSGTRPVFKNGKEEKTKLTAGSFVLHVDTSERSFSIEKDGEIIMSFADHHAETDSTTTSAAEMVFKIMTEAGAYKIEPWMHQLKKLTNEVDNLSYVNKSEFTENYFKNEWPKTLHALHDFLPYEKVIEFIKEGRDPYKPFTEEELNSILVEQEVAVTGENGEQLKDASGKVLKERKELPLKELVTRCSKDAATSLKRVDVALNEMKAQGIKTESALLGRVVFNTLDTEIDSKGDIKKPNYIPEGFLATKALGGDTYITYNQSKGNFFINSTTKDLRLIIEEIRKIVPGAKLIRGVMILPGRDATGRENLTKEKLLGLCGLIDKDTKLYDKYISPAEKAQMKEDDRMILEEKISNLEEKIQEKMREVKILEEDNELNTVHLKTIDQELAEIEKMERELAREEENKTLPQTLSRARRFLEEPISNTAVKPEESLVRFERPLKRYAHWLDDPEITKDKELLEERLNEIGKKTYTKEDLNYWAKQRDTIDYELRMHKLQNGKDKNYDNLLSKLEAMQKIYTLIEKSLKQN